MKKIVSATITPLPKTFFDDLPEVWVRVEGEENEQFLFAYYPCEISFEACEFFGLTIAEAKELKRQKDVAYLKSDGYLFTKNESTMEKEPKNTTSSKPVKM